MHYEYTSLIINYMIERDKKVRYGKLAALSLNSVRKSWLDIM